MGAHVGQQEVSYVREHTLHRLQERVGLLGPVAGIMGRLLEAELQAHPYETRLRDDMIEKSADEVYGPFCARDIEEREHIGNTEGQYYYDDEDDGYEESSDSYGYDHIPRQDPDRRHPERRQSRWREPERRERIPREPGVYTDRRERERYGDDRPPLARNKGCGRRFDRI